MTEPTRPPIVARALALGCVLLAPALWISACSETVGGGDAAATSDGGGDGSFNAGAELRIPVPAGERVHVSLATPAVVTPADPWDLAFEGLEVLTNSGPSGPGRAAAFGPLDPVVFLEDIGPDVPFLSSDRTGGAFVRWYAYEGPPTHALHSRFHVFGVKDGARLYKVQILGYYGRRNNAPVAALYRIRYAEVGGGEPAKEAADLDGTAAGDAKGECIDLGTGARAMLTSEEARASQAWLLCFRRQDVSGNGESGGPRGVVAVDLDADRTETEKVEEVALRTPEGEAARFDAASAASFEGRTFAGDRVVSAFSGLWTVRGADPARPGQHAWVVIGGDGKRRYLVGFPRFEGATASAPGTIVMRVKATP